MKLTTTGSPVCFSRSRKGNAKPLCDSTRRFLRRTSVSPCWKPVPRSLKKSSHVRVPSLIRSMHRRGGGSGANSRRLLAGKVQAARPRNVSRVIPSGRSSSPLHAFADFCVHIAMGPFEGDGICAISVTLELFHAIFCLPCIPSRYSRTRATAGAAKGDGGGMEFIARNLSHGIFQPWCSQLSGSSFAREPSILPTPERLVRLR